MKIVDKIGFIVHEPALWVHYSSVWKELGHENFVIILTDRFRDKATSRESHGVADFLEKVGSHGYEIVWVNDLPRNGIKYRYIVSNHKISGSSLSPAPLKKKLLASSKNSIKQTLNLLSVRLGIARRYKINYFDPQQYLPLQLGEKQIRFMYGADIGDGWSLASWNELYDLFLCHGLNDEEQVAKRFKGKTFQMGYPRYDGYFDPDLDVSAVLEEFKIDPLKKTVLWMPTFGDGACSIPHFAEVLAEFNQRYNFIVRPHPISFVQKPEDIDLLQSFGYQLDRNAVRDMNKLYKIVDVVLCDYGGSAFGAIYLGKQLVLLDVSKSKDWYTVQNSSNLELIEHFPVLNVTGARCLSNLLEDKEYWVDQKTNVEKLRAKYFADFRGNSSKKVGEILSRLDDLL